MDYLKKELARARVKDEDCPVNGFGRQVALERLVNRHAVHVGVVNEPDNLVSRKRGARV